MEPFEIAAHIGAALAAFGATWVGLVAKMQRKVSADQQKIRELTTKLNELERALTETKESLKNTKENHNALLGRFERADEQLRRTVTDDEFGAYTRQTTTAVNGLTERVSRVMGVLDASSSS